MFIHSLEVESVRRIRHVTIEPSGNVTIIGGKNGQGKSSLIAAVEMLFGGKKLFGDDPVRHGSDVAVVCTWSEVVARIEDRWERRAAKMIGGRIVASAHWFESKEARTALIALGEGLARSGDFFPDSVREEWRKAMKTENTSA